VGGEEVRIVSTIGVKLTKEFLLMTDPLDSLRPPDGMKVDDDGYFRIGPDGERIQLGIQAPIGPYFGSSVRPIDSDDQSTSIKAEFQGEGVTLFLSRDETGIVRLHIEHEKGSPVTALMLYPSGKMFHVGNCQGLGLNTDETGQLIIEPSA
jgi:hypothetical protein